MEELINQITAAVRGMWRYRWTGLVVAWAIGLIGAVVVIRIPDRYEASARIFVDTQSILKPLMSGLAVQPNIDQQVTMLSRTLMSRPNIEKLVRMADLDLKASSKADQDALVERLMKSVSISSAGRDNLYTLSFADSDREKAKRVIQSMVSIFVESSLGASRKDTDSAKSFLDEQIKVYEAKLEDAETRLKEFRLRNIELQSGEGKDAASRLSDISQQVKTAKLELAEAENARDAAKKQLDSEKASAAAAAASPGNSPAPEAAAPVFTPEIDARIDVQKRNLDSLLQRFTEQHPDIVSTRRLIKELEDQRRREVAELRKAAQSAPATGGSMMGANFAAQEMSRLLAATELQVASLKARVKEYEARYALGKEALKTAPQVEAEAAQLNRDYGVVKKSYEDLVARRQAAVMSGDLDMASGVADFRLIDPPRVSPKPVSPNRVLLLPGVFVLAVVAGLLVSLATSQLRTSFHDPQELVTKTGVPFLGVVSQVLSPEDLRRERVGRLQFFAGAGGLVGVFVLMIATVAILAARAVG